jgi:hypothetical protein
VVLVESIGEVLLAFHVAMAENATTKDGKTKVE